jgi:hypothetical protein
MRALAIVAFAMIGVVQQAAAQDGTCWLNDLGDMCNAIAQHAQMTQAAVGIASIGGNPVPGASSTLGMRIGKIPRITVALRGTAAFMNLQNVRPEDTGDDEKGVATSVNLDAAVGLLSGWSLAPTIGGFGSVDLLASVGRLMMPDEFTQSGTSWAVGARLGILRESFTAPGVSVTGMYRSIGDIRYGTTDGCEVDACATYTLTDNKAMSLRAVIGKRLFVLGANAGIGYDKFSSQPNVIFGSTGSGLYSELEQDRFTAFGNVAWTMLIVNVVVEGGYQRGDGEFGPMMLPPPFESRTQNSTYYGSLAVRLAL